jgi:N-acetylglucosamine-6-phosphate deacetylase
MFEDCKRGLMEPFRRCLGIENRKGTLRPGADADFVVLDRKGNVLNTWVRGMKVWSKGL